MKKLVTTLVVVGVLLIIFLLLGPFYVVHEGEQTVTTRFGKIVNNETEAGLKFKIPLVDTVIRYPQKILSWDGEPQRIPTKENQFIWVDTTARWQITNPSLFYESVNTLLVGSSRLSDIINSTIRTIISENFLNEAVRSTNDINLITLVEQVQNVENLEDADQLRNLTSTSAKQETIQIGRENLSKRMLEIASRSTEQEFGIKIIDIVIRQIRYSDDLTQSVYQRMIKERNQIAEAYRSYGQGQHAKWLGKTENDKKNIISQAYAESEEIKGIADARATNIYADAYEADPEFFTLWRTLESYKKTIPQLEKIFSTDMVYFNKLYSPLDE